MPQLCPEFCHNCVSADYRIAILMRCKCLWRDFRKTACLVRSFPNISSDVKFVLFADDTNIFIKAKNKMLAYGSANNILANI